MQDSAYRQIIMYNKIRECRRAVLTYIPQLREYDRTQSNLDRIRFIEENEESAAHVINYFIKNFEGNPTEYAEIVKESMKVLYDFTDVPMSILLFNKEIYPYLISDNNRMLEDLNDLMETL